MSINHPHLPKHSGWNLPKVIADKIKGVKGIYWYGMFNVVDTSIDIIKRDGAIRIVEHIDIETWKEFMSGLSALKKQCVVYTDCVPDSYKAPKNVTLINLYSVSVDVSNSYKKQVVQEQQFSDIEYDYFLPYQRHDPYRETIFEILKNKNVLTNSLYSCPARPGRKAKLIEGKRAKAGRFNHRELSKLLQPYMHKCLCYISLENGPLTNFFPIASDKSLMAFKNKMPSAWLMHDNKAKLLQSWGFKCAVKNIPELIRLKTVNRKQWFDKQRSLVETNYKLVDELPDRLTDKIMKRFSLTKI
jgi:hypothetical protein|tara:strand:+ start:8571 stop:9473 length:903 start_codon:yes stop_codon:yes gene_type:complete